MRYRIFVLTIFLLLVFQPILGARDIYIPTPFQTTKQAEQEMVLNGVRHKIQQYQSRLSPDDILDFYTEYLSQDDWVMNELNLAEQAGYEYEFESDYEGDENLPELKTTLFIKGEDMILLTFLDEPMGANTNYVLNYSYGMTQIFDDKDSPGEDLAFIPRYPGSIRYTSIESEGVAMLNYRSKDTKEQIERFYQKQMARFGWTQGRELTFKEKMSRILNPGSVGETSPPGLMFENKRGHCVIKVVPIEELNLNNITIMFIPEGE